MVDVYDAVSSRRAVRAFSDEPMYPAELVAPYAHRAFAAAAQRHEALGIERDAPDRRRRIAALNTQAFGAPVVLFCYVCGVAVDARSRACRDCTPHART